MTKIKAIYRFLADAFPTSIKTTLWLLKLMLPISLIVSLLQYYGVIAWLATYLDPVFVYLGLPGESAIAWLTAASLTTYAGVAVMLSLELTMREATILALMALICHALPLESAVVKRVGSNPLVMAILRIIGAFAAAVLLNAILPDMPEPLMGESLSDSESSLQLVFLTWLKTSARLSVMIFMIIFMLLTTQRVLDRLGIMKRMTKSLTPLMRVFGLPDNAAYLWIVGNVLGISYGSAAMLELEERGQISKEEANEVNYHLIMNHSMLEDTLVYVAIGISAFWILSIRISFAFILVWTRKVMRHIKHRLLKKVKHLAD